MKIEEYNEIVQVWIKEVEENKGKDVERTLKCCNDIIAYGVQHGDSRLIGFGHYNRGETYYLLNNGNRFFEEISKALSYLDHAEEWDLMARCYNLLGIWATNRGNAPIAQDYYLNGVNYCRKYHLHKMEAILYINIAALNTECGRYSEAQAYLEQALTYISSMTKDSSYHMYMVGIYQNMAKCLIPQQLYEQVSDIICKVYHDHWEMLLAEDKLSMLCTEAIFYHKTKNITKRDRCIEEVQRGVQENIVLLDLFDDYYKYTLMLMEAGKEDAFWQMVDILEPLIKNCNILNLQLKLISLKIQYYRMHGKSAEYLQAAGLYYEISEMMERETRNMMNNVLNLRKNLEKANRARQEMELQNRILVQKSEMDPLTKLANRFRLNDYSEEIFSVVCRTESTLAVEILDIDYFKEYNDNYGHQAGDHCLVSIAEAIKYMAQTYHAFGARYGGDEFVIIYTGVTKEEAVERAEELKQKVLETNIAHKFSKACDRVTISQGLCWGAPQTGNRMWDFLHTADDMLYKVKRITRNNYCVGTIADSEDCVIGPMK